eukprot:gene13020-13149_t
MEASQAMGCETSARGEKLREYRGTYKGRLFHKVRNNQNLLSKVTAVPGDITLSHLGLEPAVRHQLQQDVNIILHCAADIRLEVDIQSALTANYFGLQAVLELAAQVNNLLAFVHVSSCFVNMNQPVSSVVAEKLYSLSFGDQTVDCRQLVQDLMLLPAGAANTRATALGMRWGFPNNYTFSKHLAEQLVSHHHATQQLPVAIVRPSLVCAVAYEPLPGHAGNFAGPIGASAALALGFYHSLKFQQQQHIPNDSSGGLEPRSGICPGTSPQVQAVLESTPRDDRPVQARPSCCEASTPVDCFQSGPCLLAAETAVDKYCTGFFSKILVARGSPQFSASDHVSYVTMTSSPAGRPHGRSRLCGLGKAAARLHSGYEALCVYGTSKTDKDLVFSAAALQCLEAALVKEEQQQYPLVMQPGMPLPQPPVAGGNKPDSATSKHASSSSSSKAGSKGIITEADKEAGPDVPQPSILQGQQQCLTWRRYFHSQLAAVYSLLFRAKVPQVSPGVGLRAPLVEHDFVFLD